MSDFWGKTDNSTSTRLRYDLIAEHNVRAYISAIKKATRNQKENEFIFNIIWWIVKNCLIMPVVSLIKLVFYLILKRRQKQRKSS